MKHASDDKPLDEATLAGLARTGSRDAFEALVRMKQSWLRNFLRRLTNDPALADDLSQQAMLAAWRGIGTLQTNRAFHAWLKRIAINTWLKHVRRNEPLDAADVLEEGDIDERTLPRPGQVGERIDLDHALAALPPDVRLCIVLCHGEGLSHGDIAALTDFPLGTVKSHICRGTGIMRKILAIYGNQS